MAKLTGKTQKELDNAVDSLGGGAIRPRTKTAPARKSSGTAKPSRSTKTARRAKGR